MAAGVVALVVVAWFWVPGAAVACSVRLPGLALAAVAPLITLGFFGMTAIVAGEVGLRWSAWVAITPVLATAAAVAGWRALRRSRTRTVGVTTAPAARPPRRLLVGSIVIGVLGQLVPVAIGMGRPGRLLTAYDAVGHFNTIEFIRATGRASSLLVSGLDTPDGASNGFDGAAWHSVVALVGTWPDTSVVFNVGFFLPSAVCWTIGLAYLAQVTFPSRPRVWRWAALMSASGVALPLYLALRPEGMVPNAMGDALVPAFLGLVTSRHRVPVRRWLGLVVVAAAGVGLTHPDALLVSGLVLVPWVLPRVWRVSRRALATSTGRELLVAAYGSAATAVVLVGNSSRMRGVTSYTPESALPVWSALLNVLSGNATGMAWASGFLIVALGSVGAVVARRIAGAQWLALAAVVIVLTYLLATSAIPVLRQIDRPWYGEPKRFAPVIGAVLIPLAAVALDSLPGWLRATRRLVSVAPVRRDRLVVGVLVVGMSMVPAAIGTAVLVRESYQGSSTSAPVATDSELAMMHRLRTELDPSGVVLGSPFSGAAHLYGLIGQSVLYRSPFFEGDPVRDAVLDRLDEFDSNPKICQVLEGLDVRYLYVEQDSRDMLGQQMILRQVTLRDVKKVDSGGTASVYEITGC